MPGYKKTPNAKPIINITLSEDLLNKIEDFRFNERIPSRSQAISILIEYGFISIDNNSKKVEEKG
ncbi:hypothetical protein [Metabacillus malikii]|uniref:Metal-responsive CopG/Arc/MetJ family transcriptional regulator n=1 Tax=Metabacillus malikii TaxID=1504265 RepID=A0ABT9ZDG5_9BACI|nr:hypothetical protein [Metabacillus malikii]MDQ0230279.1 metal-responsive CopG/Arc/MetJ family transcriptional regulator [Metabacillus malikii]